MFRNFTRTMLRVNTSPLYRAPVKNIVCMDIECTCDSPVQIHPMEVIEIACIKLDLNERGSRVRTINPKVSFPTFHRYVKPVINPQLTEFCQELTGIMPKTIESADHLGKVLKDLMIWLQIQDLIDENLEKKLDFAFATCGNFDLRTINNITDKSLYQDHHEVGTNDLDELNELPIYFKEWINVKKTFVNHKRVWPKGLYNMLALLDREPNGRLHSAKDDCRNLATIIECLHQDGCEIFVTDSLKRK